MPLSLEKYLLELPRRRRNGPFITSPGGMGRVSARHAGSRLGEIRRTQTLTEILGPLIWINGPASEEQMMRVDALRHFGHPSESLRPPLLSRWPLFD